MTALALLLLAAPLQPLVDRTPAGAVLVLPPGTWEGPVVLWQPITLEGADRATITGGGQGTVVTVRAADVTLSHLRVEGSGRRHDQMDAAVLVEGARARVQWVEVADSLFGVFVRGAPGALVCGCRIGSVDDEPGLRGDGVRLWNTSGSLVQGNEVHGTRDVALANAPGNTLRGNAISGGRLGVHLVFSPRTLVEGNRLTGNLAGLAALTSPEVVVRGNLVAHSTGRAGACLTFKDSGGGLVEDNDLVHCAVGARLNAPPGPGGEVVFRGNRFAHHVAALDFYGENGGHVFHGNRFTRNLVPVTVSAPMSARGNDWLDNAWDDYQGFDADGDLVGDTPHELWAFTDSLYTEEPMATFFRNSPALELLDFLERLAPFSSPELTLRDPRPSLAPDLRPPRPGPFVRACP